MRSLGKSDFAGLVDYITDEQERTERLGHVQTSNCQAGTLEAAIDEVLATQHINTRAQGDKTYHLLLSFPPGENPPADVLAAIEERICNSLGYGEHQRISAVHHDTNHMHVHIAINKIHPTRNTMHEPFQAYRTLGEVCTKLENEYGLQKVNHEPRRRVSESRATDMEQHSGIESLVSWVRRECLEDIRGAQSWGELHQALQANGLELRQRANGFVIEASDGTTVKASTVARDLSKPALEARLGSFASSPAGETIKPATPARPQRTYQKAPVRMRVNTVELYAKYKAEQSGLTAARAEALAKAKRRKNRAIEAAKQSNRLRRATVKIVDGKDINKRVLYSQAAASLRSTMEEIHKDYAKERERLYAGFQRKAWADWLKQEATKGDAEALAALRSREAAQGLKGNTFKAAGQARPGGTYIQDGITKTGTIVFRAGRAAVRDDGDKLQVSREATRESLRAALQLAAEKYGERITVNGTAAFKAQIVRAAVDSNLPITFADPGLERLRLEYLTKENRNVRPEPQPGQPDPGQPDRGRRDSRSDGLAIARPAADQHATQSGATDARRHAIGARRAGPALDATRDNRKPNIGRLGRVPPPQSKNRLRSLSQLGVVRIAGGAEMLLPRDVPRNLEQQGPKPDNALRRGVSGSGRGVTLALAGATLPAGKGVGRVPPPQHQHAVKDLAHLGVVRIAADPVLPARPVEPPKRETPPRVTVPEPVKATPQPEPAPRRGVSGAAPKFSPEALAAADKYIAEREQKRLKGFDIPEHSRYNQNASVLLYAGVRNIEGQSLALLRRDDSESIMVLPVDQATARRLSRIAVGDPVSLTPKGSIKTSKGRGR